MTAAEYLFRANVCLTGLFGLYWLLFRRHTFFSLNRAYLLLTLAATALLPLVQLPAPAVKAVALPVVTLSDVTVGATMPDSTGQLLTNWLWGVYLIGVAVGVGRLLLALGRLARLVRAGERLALPGFTLVLLDDERIAPFSFFRFLVMNRTDFATHPDPILRHEQVHIRQWHSLDVLLAEVVRITCWPNPVAWLLQRALQQTHEFLADESATDAANRADYARFLVGYALGTGPESPTNSFISVSQLKSRIIMLQTKPTNRRALLGYALALPLALGLLMCTQEGKEVKRPESAPTVSGEIFTVVEEQPEFPGGMDGLGDYLGKQIKYPAAAEKANVEGRVFVQFVVTDKGEITRVKVLKGIGFGADEEAARVMREMPRWIPGKQGGKPVNVQYNLPIMFQLEDKKSAR